MIEIATSSTATDVAKKQMKMLTMLFLFGIYFILINSIKTIWRYIFRFTYKIYFYLSYWISV